MRGKYKEKAPTMKVSAEGTVCRVVVTGQIIEVIGSCR